MVRSLLDRLNISLFSQTCLTFSFLFDASHNIGFFLLRHDIPASVCDQAMSETNNFFQRPINEKMLISYEKSASFRGYMPLGVENTEGRMDGREQIEYAAEYDLNQKQTGNNSEQQRPFYHRLRSTNPWPDAIQPTLRPAIMEYVTAVLHVADQLRDAMCLALSVDQREVASLFGGKDGDEPSFWSMKLISYPPVSNGAVDTTNTEVLEQGVGAHCDSNLLTLICQDPESSGLQVQTVQGGWIDVPPTDPNVLVCNIGELAEVWSGGFFVATPHRVLRNSSSASSRLSLPIFYNPKLDVVMKPLNTDKLPWQRRQQNQWRRKHNKLMSSVGKNSFKSLARSHPSVFERHHADLRIMEDGSIVER